MIAMLIVGCNVDSNQGSGPNCGGWPRMIETCSQLSGDDWNGVSGGKLEEPEVEAEPVCMVGEWCCKHPVGGV